MRKGDCVNHKHCKVSVIGAGIVGVATAIWLARDGHEVTLVDRLAPGEATSHGNGGVLASCAVVPVTVPGLAAKAPRMLLDRQSPLFLRWSYLPKLLPWLAKYLSHCTEAETARIATALLPVIGDSLEQHQALAAGTGAERWLRASDYLYVYRDRAAFEADGFAWSLRRDAGFRWDILEDRELRDYEPLIGPDNRFAVKLPDHGVISDPGRYVKDLATHFESLGGRVLRADVRGFRFGDGRLAALETDAGAIDCGRAVLAAGVWSKDLGRQLGIDVPMESERGYHLELEAPDAYPCAPLMMTAGKFVATPLDGRIRLAGIVEFGGRDAGPSDAPFKVLETQARRAMPTLKWTALTRWMGHRPAPADSIPLIGPSPRHKDVLMAFGHHHVGLTGGPRSGRLIADLVAGRTPNIDMAPYSPGRFAV
ncbi:FAD-binding oxidoreductase [Stappia sp. ES.058]|uniref:NAD(P)/FAD-dependent oxidoreductase n=1 Tax=Stappia sp. ES.058 TaxID=1881061 RepID=UPI00087C35DB|nr:FAD-dependent oxidoreductase [Stappia sp. ES.058]SDU27315.1 D-amino-acid dehydrogenase [Stappia sp. ES.058]